MQPIGYACTGSHVHPLVCSVCCAAVAHSQFRHVSTLRTDACRWGCSQRTANLRILVLEAVAQTQQGPLHVTCCVLQRLPAGIARAADISHTAAISRLQHVLFSYADKPTAWCGSQHHVTVTLQNHQPPGTYTHGNTHCSLKSAPMLPRPSKCSHLRLEHTITASERSQTGVAGPWIAAGAQEALCMCAAASSVAGSKSPVGTISAVHS